MRGRMKKQHLTLTESEIKKLQAISSEADPDERIYKRARGLLALHSGKTYVAAANMLGVSYATVMEWAKKHQESGLAFLEDKPRKGRPPVLSREECEVVLELARQSPPAGKRRWSLRLLAEVLSEKPGFPRVSHVHVGSILKRFGIKLHERAGRSKE